jgi:hypothetical protein
MRASSKPRSAMAAAASTLAIILGLALVAPAGATTFCVPGFDPERCPDDGQNVAQADLETALQSDATDGEPDELVVAPGTYTDADTFSPSGSDPLTVEGAGAGVAADPDATRLTTAASGNVFVVNLGAASLRPIVMRDLTVVVPAALPDSQGAGMQVFGDTLERVDVEVANPGSDGIPSWPGGGSFEEGSIYPVGAGLVRRAIASGNSGIAGPISIEDATLVEPQYGIWAEHEAVPVTVERTVVEHPSQIGVFVTESGAATMANSIVVLDGSADALQVNSNNGGEASLSADHVTLVQEGSPVASIGASSRSTSTGSATMLVENSILRGFTSSYFRHSDGSGGEADLTIGHSNFPPQGPDIGPGTLDLATANIDADPLFAGAPPYGAPADLELEPGSPSIDAGDPAPGGEPADFLGAPRPLDGDEDGSAVRDQGAFEAAPPAPEPPSDPEPEDEGEDDSPPAPAPPLVAAPPADGAVAVRLLGRRAPVARRGFARLRLHCPRNEATPPCRGRVLLLTRARLRLGGKRRRVVLARAGFRLAPGATRSVRLRLGAAKLRLLKRNRRARGLLAVARVRDGAGNRRVVRKRLRAAVR